MVEQRPSLKIDIFYSFITLGSTLVWSIVGNWLLYFYLPPAGEGAPRAPAAFYSLVIFGLHAFNIALAPYIGRLSDHTRNRWGRRLPYMAVAALPLVVFFVLLWTPPVPGESLWNLIYLAVILELYYLSLGLLEIPFAALLPEIAQTDHHRVRISSFSAGFLLIGFIVSGFAGLLIDRAGYFTAALIYAAIALPLFYAPFLVLRERPGRQIPAAQRLNFRQGVKIMLNNRAFLILVATGLCYWSATTAIQAAVPFIVTEITLSSKADALYFYLPAVLASLACYPVVLWLADRLGKWRVFMGSLAASALVLPGLAFLGPWLPIPLMAQGILWITLQAVAMSGVIVLPPAFAAEITDEDEKVTGQRREGAYYSVWGMLDQVVKGLAGASLPLMLMLGSSHTDPNGPLGVRSIGLLGGALLFVGFLIFRRYPLRSRPGAEAALTRNA